MDHSTAPSKKSSSTRLNQNKIKEKYARKSHGNVLNGDNIKLVRYKEEDAEKLKEKYIVRKSNAHIPFDKDFLDSINASKENKMETDTIVKSPEIEEIVSPKVNVFQFMMNSRHKVIGSNSPGKEKKPEPEKIPEEIAEKKDKFKKRKAALGEWAEKKGGQKRKLADEAQEEHIKKTLKERAKRLKKMLEIIDEDLRNSSHDESDHEIKSTTKTSIRKSEEIKLKSTEIDKTDKPEIQKSEDKTEIVSTENLHETPITRTKRKKKFNSSNLEEIQGGIKTNEDVKETPKRRTRRKQNISESENVQIKVDKIPDDDKNIIEEHNEEANNLKISETNENENIVVESNKKSTRSVKKSIDCLSLKKNKKTITPEAEKKTEPELITESTKHLTNDDNEDIFPVNTPVSNKKTRQLKLFQDSNTKKIEEENKSFTPKSWKMKVRLFEKENINDELDGDVQSVIIIDDNESPKKTQIQGKISNFFGSTTSLSNKSGSSENSKNKDVKLAPLFVKQQSKKPTKADVEAKKKFLYSGMPEQVKKIIASKQQSIIETEYDLFPKISHVQQRSLNDETLHLFWDLPNTSLLLVERKLETIDKITFDSLITYGTLTDCNKIETRKKHIYSPPLQLPNLQEHITSLKKEYPNYPVYKTFRLLYEKHVKHNKIETSESASTPKSESGKKRRGRPKRTKLQNKQEIEATTPFKESQMWTEKYRPLCEDDIIGNYSSVKQLKSWLQSWVHYSNDQKSMKKRKRANSSSDDFCNDSDTRDTADALPQNMIILVGAFGTGKTASVYALCNELNINVIEINASSKRTGKRILTELQEATQSHQVKNTDSKSVSSFFQKKTDPNTNNTNHTNQEVKEEENKKLSLLLMEDVDIVFDDQDDGFISSLTTLVGSSKRPIILTTSDKNCLHLQKLFSQHDVIDFTSISCRVASPWLQILCLIEGIQTDRVMIERLLEWNQGDVRKTILQLQFWVQSGGDSNTIYSTLNVAKNNLKLTKSLLSQHDEEFKATDESSNLSWFQSDTSKFETNTGIIHKNCVEYFTPFYEKDKMCFQLAFPINLGNIWWNIPSILNVNTIEHKEIFKRTETLSNIEKVSDDQSDVDCSQNATKYISDAEISSDNNDSKVLFHENSHPQSDLNTAVDFLESLVFTDTMYVKLKANLDFEPTPQFWQIRPINSLLLTENYEMYDATNNLAYEISHWLVEKNIQKCKAFKDYEFNVNVAVPDLEERRWRIKIYKSMEDVTDIIPPFCLLDRTGICEDYFPFMRTICRMENNRFANNNKRKNRFYHYFKTFNIHISDSTNFILCNSLAIKND